MTITINEKNTLKKMLEDLIKIIYASVAVKKPFTINDFKNDYNKFYIEKEFDKEPENLTEIEKRERKDNIDKEVNMYISNYISKNMNNDMKQDIMKEYGYVKLTKDHYNYLTTYMDYTNRDYFKEFFKGDEDNVEEFEKILVHYALLKNIVNI
jgi:hypothetical protein